MWFFEVAAGAAVAESEAETVGPTAVTEGIAGVRKRMAVAGSDTWPHAVCRCFGLDCAAEVSEDELTDRSKLALSYEGSIEQPLKEAAMHWMYLDDHGCRESRKSLRAAARAHMQFTYPDSVQGRFRVWDDFRRPNSKGRRW